MKRLQYYLKIWLLLSRNSFQMIISQRVAFWFFLSGKVIRFIIYIGFLYFLLKGAQELAGYSPNQVILFFIIFNLVDVISQFLFREVYRFRPKIISGDFDLAMLKPINPLFLSLMGGADLMDLITLPPLLLIFSYIVWSLNISSFGILLFVLLIINALLIAASFYIIVLSLGIITFEIDNVIIAYRDVSSLGRFPVDVYKEPLKGLLTFIVPVGIMMTFPGKALLGVISPTLIIVSFIIGISLFLLSLKFWNFALKKYTSASS